MGGTLGLYSFYVVPKLAKGVNHLIQKDKFNSTAVFWIGVLTLGLGLSVFEVLFACDLEKNPAYTGGKWSNRRLGLLVFILNVLTWMLAFMSGTLAFIGSFVLGVSATLLIQHEINQYVDMNENTTY
jgi:hypothetical protein